MVVTVKRNESPNCTSLLSDNCKTKGDGLGYDIRSYTAVGNLMCIEVKTTTKSLKESLFFTQNEIDFMKKNSDSYYLYRVYEYDSATHTGKFIVLKGYPAIADYFEIKPNQYKGRINL